MKKQRHRINIMLFLSWEEGKILSYINHEKTNHTQIKKWLSRAKERMEERTKNMDAYKTSIVSTLSSGLHN